MSAAADLMRQTMPDYGPGDVVQTCDGTRYIVYSVRFVPLGSGQTCGWRTQTSKYMDGPSGIDRMSSEFSLVPETPAAAGEPLGDAPFTAGDIVQISRGSPLQQHARFMLRDKFEVVECFQAKSQPQPDGQWLLRICRHGTVAPQAVPIDVSECFAAKYFELCSTQSETIVYVKSVRLADNGQLQVEYGRVAVPLPQ